MEGAECGVKDTDTGVFFENIEAQKSSTRFPSMPRAPGSNQ
jgi:hypothetical protein